jgi:arsenate reductase-like glutaredoxin family protein
MTWRNLPDGRKAPESDAQWAQLVAEFPALVRRPVMVDADGSVSVGFSDKKYSELLGG